MKCFNIIPVLGSIKVVSTEFVTSQVNKTWGTFLQLSYVNKAKC